MFRIIIPSSRVRFLLYMFCTSSYLLCADAPSMPIRYPRHSVLSMARCATAWFNIVISYSWKPSTLIHITSNATQEKPNAKVCQFRNEPANQDRIVPFLPSAVGQIGPSSGTRNSIDSERKRPPLLTLS